MSNTRLISQKNFIVISDTFKSVTFDLPFGFGKKDLQSLAVKKFLGVSSRGPLFDGETKKALMNWQRQNKKTIGQIAGWIPKVSQETEYPEFFFELGQVHPATLVAMQLAGTGPIDNKSLYPKSMIDVFFDEVVLEENQPSLKQAIDAAYEEIDSIAATVPNESKKFVENITPAEIVNEPFRDESLHYVVISMGLTRQDVGEKSIETLLLEEGARLLQIGTKYILDYYGKENTWNIDTDLETGAVFLPVINYQKRSTDTKEYTLTIENVNLLQAIGADEEAKTINVLLGQSLSEGDEPTFASIRKVFTPELRESSTYKALICIRSKMLDAIPTSKKTVLESTVDFEDLDQNISPILDDISEKLNSLGMDVSQYNEDSFLQKSKNKEAAKKYLKKYDRQLKILKKRSQLGLVDASAVEQAKRMSELKQYTAKGFDFEPFPMSVAFKISDLEDDFKKSIRILRFHGKRLKKLYLTGTEIKPSGISLNKEADRLDTFYHLLRKLARDNDFTISKDNEGHLAFAFDPVLTSGDSVGQFIGAKIKSVAYIPKGNSFSMPIVLSSGVSSFLSSTPTTRPTTVGYFLQLDEIIKQSNNNANSVAATTISKDFRPAVAFLLNYHHPTPEIDLNSSTQNTESQFNRNTETRESALDRRMSQEFNNLKEEFYKKAVNEVYSITDKLKYEGEVCDLDDIFKNFFNKFDWWSVFDDYYKLKFFDQPGGDSGPLRPQIEWDFDFSIPNIPKLPTFDPIAMIEKQLEITIQDLITGTLCGLIDSILKALAQGASMLQLPGIETINNLLGNDKVGGFIEAPTPDSTVGKKKEFKKSGLPLIGRVAKEAFDRMGIPTNFYVNISDVFDKVSLGLTATELAGLLRGNADIDTLNITLKVIEADCSDLKKFVYDTSLVQELFEIIGEFVSDDILDRLENSADVILGDLQCPEDAGVGDIVLRDTLEALGASTEEVNRALEQASERREAISSLLRENPLDSTIKKLGPQTLPNPYLNDNNVKLAEIAAKAVYGNIEVVFDNDLLGYVPSLFEGSQRPLTYNDPEYDHVGMARYFFVQNQLDSINRIQNENRRGQAMLSVRKPGQLVFEGQSKNGSFDVSGRIASKVVIDVQPARLSTRDIGTGALTQTNAPDYFNFNDISDSDLFEKILLTPTKNIKIEPSVFPSFKSYLLEEKRTFVGVTTGPYIDFRGIETDDIAGWFELASFYNMDKVGPQLQARLSATTKHFEDDLEIFSDREVDTRTLLAPFSCQMVDQFFIHTVTDCFQIDRPPRVFENELRSMQTFNYHSEISVKLQDLRKRAPDMSLDTKKLLRPEAFAQFVHEKLRGSVELAKKNRLYYGDIYLESEGFFNDQFLKDWKIDSHLWQALSYNASLNSEEYNVGHYTKLYQNFMTKVASSVASSRYFNLDSVNQLARKITTKYLEDIREDKICLIKNKNLPIDFEKIRSETILDYKESLNSEKYNPINRDFSKPGPLEESFSDQLIFLYMRTFIIEFVLKSIFIFSRFKPSHLLSEKYILEYLYDYIKVTIEKDFENSNEYKINFYDRVKSITNTEDEKEALITIMSSLLNDVRDEVTTMADKLFEPEYSSFLEEFYVGLVNEYFDRSPPNAGLAQASFADLGRSTIPLTEVYNDQVLGENLRSPDSAYNRLSMEDGKDGFFMIENYFYVKPPENDPNKLAKLISAAYDSLGVDNYSLYARQPGRGHLIVDVINPDLHAFLSRRMNTEEYHDLLKICTPPNEPDQETDAAQLFQSLIHYVKSNTVIGMRTIYVSGNDLSGADPIIDDSMVFRRGSQPANSIATAASYKNDVYVQGNTAAHLISNTRTGPLKVGINELNSFIFEVANSEILIDCFDNFGRITRNTETLIKNILLAYEDNLINSLLGLSEDAPAATIADQGLQGSLPRRLVREDYNEDMKVLFEEIFPLNRMSGLFLINEQSFFDSKPIFRDFMGGSRGAIRSTYRILQNKKSIGSGDEGLANMDQAASILNSNQGSKGPTGGVVDAVFSDLKSQILKMVVRAPILALRGQANLLDPGYARMSKMYEDDPCKLKEGLTWGSVKSPNYIFPYYPGTETTFTNGYEFTLDDTFVPLTLGAPIDIGLSVKQMLSGLALMRWDDAALGLAGLSSSIIHTTNSIRNKQKYSYGPALGPVGMLALALPHLPGEEPRKLQAEAKCNLGRRSKNLPTVICSEEGEE